MNAEVSAEAFELIPFCVLAGRDIVHLTQLCLLVRKEHPGFLPSVSVLDERVAEVRAAIVVGQHHEIS